MTLWGEFHLCITLGPFLGRRICRRGGQFKETKWTPFSLSGWNAMFGRTPHSLHFGAAGAPKKPYHAKSDLIEQTVLFRLSSKSFCRAADDRVTPRRRSTAPPIARLFPEAPYKILWRKPRAGSHLREKFRLTGVLKSPFRRRERKQWEKIWSHSL